MMLQDTQPAKKTKRWVKMSYNDFTKLENKSGPFFPKHLMYLCYFWAEDRHWKFCTASSHQIPLEHSYKKWLAAERQDHMTTCTAGS